MATDPLWAPWRLEYIKDPDRPKQPKNAGCFLCQYRDQPEKDREHFVFWRGEASFAVLNRFPYNNGHVLIAPLAHKGDITELNDEELLECQQELRVMTGLLREILNAQGFNIGLNLGEVAGAGLPGHLHWHLVPRWSGDSNFMTVIGDVNVIPQSLIALDELIRAKLNALT
ncbi:HIT family protein [Calycomorphotria hydatis]|uniref:AP-4-A phosphorylase n=1 Tax=Calycomorphotria hydatis TaxID=2528027 RepID=A0A517T859_9PLAN|nr:HIT domain-containing protein [Calycomorphotria hydatis]QDT64565.1 AP-4-A phosphorylase [Calycomorphotria hydatis]